MSNLVDPIKLLQKRARRELQPTAEMAAEAGVPYEVPMNPMPGARVINMVIAGTYRQPIPVLFDPATRTTYPLPKE